MTSNNLILRQDPQSPVPPTPARTGKHSRQGKIFSPQHTLAMGGIAIE
jgi:hypothetical protein